MVRFRFSFSTDFGLFPTDFGLCSEQLLGVAAAQLWLGIWLLSNKNGIGLLVILGGGFTAMLITVRL